MRKSTLFQFLMITITFCVSTQVFAVGLPRDGGEYEDVNPVMLEFSRSIAGIRKILLTSDQQLILPYSKALRNAASDMLSLEPQINRGMIAQFNEYRETIRSLTSELDSLTQANELNEIPQIITEIRHFCISCHIKFRSTSPDSALFPNEGNVITGEVKIWKLDGSERRDRSNAIVFLDRVGPHSESWLPRKNPSISQKNRRFRPRVVPVVKGTIVDFPNDDMIFHNVFSLSKIRPFDLDAYPPGESRSVQFDKTGWVKIYCNIHPRMVSHILVLNNPFYSVTDEQGLFVISDVPDGHYTLRVWHEFAPDVGKEIDVSGSTLHDVSFNIRENKRFVQHKNKFGKPYRGKYQ